MCSNTELRQLINEHQEILANHIVEEEKQYENVKHANHDVLEILQGLSYNVDKQGQRLHQIGKSLKNGVLTFQALSIADDNTNQRIDENMEKLAQFGEAVESNADHILKQEHEIIKLNSSIKGLSSGLTPILEVLHTFQAAMPFFEMLGKTTTWFVKHFAPLVGFISIVWAWIAEPWKLF